MFPRFTGGALGPDGIPDALPGAGGVTVKWCEGAGVILEDRGDDDIGKQSGNALMPSLDTRDHKRVKRAIPPDATRRATRGPQTRRVASTLHVPQKKNYFLFCLFTRLWYKMFSNTVLNYRLAYLSFCSLMLIFKN